MMRKADSLILKMTGTLEFQNHRVLLATMSHLKGLTQQKAKDCPSREGAWWMTLRAITAAATGCQAEAQWWLRAQTEQRQRICR
jgi:hypothetical protein